MGDVLCPVMIGRTGEHEALRAALRAACAGTGSVVLVLGEAGIGKSRLARELAFEAETDELVVLRGRAVPNAARSPYRPLAEALAPYSAELVAAGDVLDPWLPALATVVPGLGDRPLGPADDSEAARGEAVVRALSTLARGRGGLLVLEDLHWADPDTLAVVDHLSDNLHRIPVLCVVTLRSEEASPGRDLARTVAARRSAISIELNRLNDAQVAAMVHACTNGAGTADLQRISNAAEGVPFLVEELLASPGLPRTFADTVQARLAVLDPSTRSVLASAATLGRHFDWHLLPAATGLDDPTVADALERGLETQLLTFDGVGFRFRHALTREAVLDSVLPPARPVVAAAALAALDGAYPELLGDRRELAAALAERAEQPERAGSLFAGIGAEALEKGALASAAVALDRATRLLKPGGERTQAALGLVTALADAGRVDDALVATNTVLADSLDHQRAAAHLRVARAAVATTRWDLARTQLAAARRHLSEDAHLGLDAEAAVLDGEIALGVGDIAGALTLAATGLAGAHTAGASDIVCQALLLRGRASRTSSLEDAQAAFSEAAAIAQSHHLPLWQLRSLHELGTIDMFERGDAALLEHARSLAEELGALATGAVLDIELCAAYMITGDDARSIARGEAALQRAADLGQVQATTAALHLLGTAYVIAGDRAAADEAATRARHLAPDDEILDASLTVAVNGIGSLLDEDRPGTITAFEVGMATVNRRSGLPPASYKGLWPLLLAVEGQDGDAAVAIEDLDTSGATVNRLNLGYMAYAQAVLVGRTAPAAAAALVEQGDRQLGHGPFWHQLGRRLVAEAAVVDRWGQPAAWLLEAGTYFDGRGHRSVTAACAAMVESPQGRGRPRHGWAFAEVGVTRREADVLELVREGLANKEIAARLYLSPRTVEKHVESLLRKTAARSRTQLATLAVQIDREAE